LITYTVSSVGTAKQATDRQMNRQTDRWTASSHKAFAFASEA